MNNEELKKEIMCARSIRENLFNFDTLTNEEKEMIKETLNTYESLKELDIRRNMNLKREYEEQGIPTIISDIILDNDLSNSRYQEYANLKSTSLTEKINIINGILIKLDSLVLSNEMKKVLLASLRSTCKDLELSQVRNENNKDLLDNYIEIPTPRSM